MTNLVGNRSDFAIEWQISDKFANLIYGSLCFWSQGRRIGDFSERTILSASVKYLEGFLQYSQVRHIELLDGKSKEEVFTYVFDAGMIVKKPGETLDEATRRYEREIPPDLADNFSLHSILRMHFHLDDIGGASFRDVNIILVNDSIIQAERMIWRELSVWQLYETYLPENHFEKIAKDFLYLYNTHLNDK